MALTTLTTAVGFGGLAFSRLPALSRGGLLVAGGTVLCLAATLLVLPAVGALAGRLGEGRLGDRRRRDARR
jgi:predicted RND superfamily exporter protein